MIKAQRNTKRLASLLLLVIITCLRFQPGLAQEYYFKNITVNNGLSQDDVNSIIQDSFGFIWIGTYDGLNRFDGITVESFRRVTSNPGSLPDNRISALAEDHKKRIWIGTQAGLFAYYSLLEEKFIRVKSPENTGSITSFFIASDSTLYATSATGILKLNNDTEPVFVSVPGTQKFQLSAGAQDVNGTIFFVGGSGAFVYENEMLTKIPSPEYINFRCLSSHTGEGLLAGSYQGLFELKKSGITRITHIEPLNLEAVYSISTDSSGNHWIGTQNQGLFFLDKSLNLNKWIKASIAEPRGLLSNTILSLYLDRSDNLWVGNRHGLCYTKLNMPGFASIKLQDLHRPNIRSLLIEDNIAYVGVTGAGLFKYDFKAAKLERLTPSTIGFYSQIESIDNTLYVCTNRGLLVSKDKKNFEKFNYEVNPVGAGLNYLSIAHDGFSKLFLGTNKGILVLEKNQSKWSRVEFPLLEPINDLISFRLYYDSSRRQLLIGTISKGLYILDLDENGEPLSFRKGTLQDINSDIVLNTSVWCFREDSNKTLWVGTDVGLFKKEVNAQHFKQVEKDGILDKKIMSIAESSDGSLWLSNTYGLIHYQPSTGRIRRYTSEDGLLSSSLTEAMQYHDDTLFFGTTNGVNFINPSKISYSPYEPQALISQIKVHQETARPGTELFGTVILNKNINATQHIELNHEQNNFSLEFSSSNYTKGIENNFRYRLEGYNDNWIYTTGKDRVASYSNLKPGKYIFYLEVANHDDNWTGKPFVLPVTIIPSPWRTPLAYASYTLLSFLIIGGFAYFWMTKQKLDHKIQLDQIKINQDKILRERQLQYFADVAHEFKTPLSLIIAPFKDLMKQTLSPEKREMCLKIISRNIQRLSFLVNQVLDFDRIAEGENILSVVENDLQQSIQDYSKSFTWQAQQQNIDLRLMLEPCVGYFDSNFLEKILYNILSNAFKHVPNGGIIEITLKVTHSSKGEFVIITISDSGSGIPDHQKKQVFDRFYHTKDRSSSGIGLHLTQRLVEAHKGTISLEDSQYGGAQFKITLPISASSYTPSEIGEAHIIEEMNDQEYESLNLDTGTEKDESILIVEDDYELRNYLKISLQNIYSVLEASNGEQGLAIAIHNMPDIIISDVMMPKMDGIEMCVQLKKNNNTSHIPVLFLTAKKETEFQNKGLEAGAWDYITKPFDSEALLKKVSNILETRNKFKSYLLDRKPNFEINTHYTSYDQKLLQDIYQVIEKNINNATFNGFMLAKEIGLSRMHLHRKLKTLAGETAKGIITRVKIKYAVEMFDQGCDRIQEAMHAVGMTNYANFNNNFKKIMNMTATDYLTNLKSKGSKKQDEPANS